ncbi:MAG: amidohydrolase, partial [Cyclobacteriaceae bacterium]|nr:amidohydrolase [Cyclobacteriaceae bacterium]
MYKLLFFLGLFAITGDALAQKKSSQKVSANKKLVITSIDNKEKRLTALSDEIWAYAEVAFQETKSSKSLADYAESQGFKVERGVAKIPTAFVATYGSGKPVIGVLGEFDALPGISQKAQPTKEAYQVGAAGQG